MESSWKQMDGAGDSTRNSSSTSKMSDEERQILRNIKTEKGNKSSVVESTKDKEEAQQNTASTAAAATKTDQEDANSKPDKDEMKKDEAAQKKADEAAAAARKKQKEDAQKKADDAAVAAARKNDLEDAQKKADDAAAAAARKKQKEDAQKKADDAAAAAARKKDLEDAQKKADDAAAAAARKKDQEDAQKKADDAAVAAARKKDQEDAQKKADDAAAAAAKKKAQEDAQKSDQAGKDIMKPIKVEVDTQLSQLPYDFVDGLPVWTERQLPKEKLRPVPPGWDVENWEKWLNRRHNERRKKNFPKLLESCKRKKEREAEEKLQKELEEEQERERRENLRKEERRRRREEMENEAEAMLDADFDSSWKLLDIVISDDEDESPKENGKEGKDKQSPTSTEAKGKNGKKDEPEVEAGETVNGKEIKTEPIDPGFEDPEVPNGRQPLGGNAEDADLKTEKSEKSMESTTGTPRSSMRLRNKTMAARQTDAAQFSEATVKILSKPALLLALEVFQGVKPGTQEDIEILKNPRVLQSLREFNSTLTIEIPQQTDIPLVQYDQKVVDTIKKEGSERRSVKRKLQDVESFAAVLKPPKKKKSKQEPELSITQTCRSPNKGTVSTRESSKTEMKSQARFHVEIMRKGDELLKKQEPKSAKQISAVFDSVSFSIEII